MKIFMFSIRQKGDPYFWGEGRFFCVVLELMISHYILRKNFAIPDDFDCGILNLTTFYGLTDIGNGCKIILKLKPLNF